MLTKSTFTRDEWNHLLRLFNIMNFSMFSCSHFLSVKKAKQHVEESSGKKDRRRTCGDEIEVSMLGIKNPERKAILLVGLGCFMQPGHSRVGSEFCFHKHWETSVWWCVWAFKHRETCARDRESTCKEEVGRPQYAKSPTVNTLRKSSITFDSSWIVWRMNKNLIRDQCIDLGIISVNNDECGSASWAKLQWKFGYAQEHQFRRAQEVVITKQLKSYEEFAEEWWSFYAEGRK